jgi:DNA-binding beta-propeller fold protein YncE
MGLGSMRLRLALAAGVALLPFAAQAEIAVSANDNKAVLENGVVKVPPNAPPDTLSIIDLSASPPKLIAEIPAPASVVGPPGSVAVAPDESYALVTAAMKVDPSDPTKQAPDDKLSVVDLKSSPPKVVDTITVGKGAAGVSINKTGTLALVANRSEGTVSVLTHSGGKWSEKEKIKLGTDKSGPSHVVFSRDGAAAYVTRDGDVSKVSVLSVQGDKVEDSKREITAGVRPYGLDVTSDGALAIAANIGTTSGDADTMSLIDLKAKPPRVVNTVTVGMTPEGIKIAPDGQHVAIGLQNGTNVPASSPFHQEKGLLKIFRISGTDATLVAEAPIGKWCQGIAWSKDSKKLLVQCMVEKEIMSFSFDGAKALQSTGSIKVNGGPAGIRTAEP